MSSDNLIGKLFDPMLIKSIFFNDINALFKPIRKN